MIYDFSLVPGPHFGKETSHGPTHHYIIEIASLCAFDLSLCWYRYSVLWSKTTLILVHEVHSSHELKDNIFPTVPSFCFIINFLLPTWTMSKSIELFCNLLDLPKINNSLTLHGYLAATLSWSPFDKTSQVFSILSPPISVSQLSLNSFRAGSCPQYSTEMLWWESPVTSSICLFLL